MRAATSSEIPAALNLYQTEGDTLARLLTITHTIDATPATEIATYTIPICRVLARGVAYDFTVTRPTSSQVNIALTPVQTAAIGAGTYPWELVWTEPGGTIRTAIQGLLVLKERTTDV